MSNERRFKQGDMVYVIHDNSIFRVTVNRANKEWFETSWRTDDSERVFGNGAFPFHSRHKQEHGHASIAQARTTLLKDLRYQLERHETHRIALTNTLAELEAQL